jgi:hypothetical protein
VEVINKGKEDDKSIEGQSLLKSSNWQKEGKGDGKDDESKPLGDNAPLNFGPSSEP